MKTKNPPNPYYAPGLRLRFDGVNSVVAIHFNIDPVILMSHKSKRSGCHHITEARFICFFILFHAFSLPKCKIATLFNLSHANIIHGINQTQNRYKLYKSFRSSFDSIIEHLPLSNPSLSNLYDQLK